MEERTNTEAQALTKGKTFKKFEIKDIVFLAILSAVMLLTGGVMPLVTGVPLFGIIQLALALQFSIIPAIGLMKVRKPGTLLFMALFSGVVLIFMFVPMFFCIVLCAILAEMLALLIFKGYDKDVACWFAATIYLPLSLPFLLVYFKLFGFTNNGAAVLASDPEILLLDEPTVGQDYDGLKEMVEILNGIHEKSGNTMITVTHDVRCAGALCDKAAIIRNGIVAETGGREIAIKFFSGQNI